MFQIGLAYVLMTRAVRHIRAVEAALLLLIEPVAATALAWWIHGERPAPWALAGCALILIGTVARTAVPSERVEPSVAGS